MSRVTVLISSFDGYSACWGPVCHGFRKYWPDCPYPVLLMTNARDYPDPMVKVLKVGGGRDWSGRMVEALGRIETPYVMYFQEDYWISSPVDTAKITSYVDLMERYRLNYIRLLAKPEPDRDFDHDERLGVLADDAPYRTSVQITFWRREVFLDLLRPEESVWQFEINGTERSRKYGATFLSVKQHGRDGYRYYHHGIDYVCTAVNSGKWSRYARLYAEREGLGVDFSVFPCETRWHDFRRHHPLGRFWVRWSYRGKLLLGSPREAIRRLGNRLAGQSNGPFPAPVPSRLP